jgi:hypothetical protein
VQRRVALAVACHQPAEARRDAGRLVDRKLLFQRDMQAHVEERIALVDVVLVAVALRLVQHGVVLGVRQDHVERDGFDADERLAGAVFAPGGEEGLPDLLARGVEHQALVFWRYSQRSRIRHSGQPGLRAMQT